ncbi:hypothetical protein SAMN05421664_0467 [Chryseobacterium soldanellicola]|uniref:Uncharacterized protein n=1 Tax=Chryseobacterium soldanellicola TaxID=311333 RepID=A0A1H0Y3V7_9FLAO|nr:hypothetical protein SAMN05421664_0467 [Chryseobacterium soldanellicola]
MKDKDNLHLKGIEFSIQEWKKSNNISEVKYSKNTEKKSNKTKVFRSSKHYSLLY